MTNLQLMIKQANSYYSQNRQRIMLASRTYNQQHRAERARKSKKYRARVGSHQVIPMTRIHTGMQYTTIGPRM